MIPKVANHLLHQTARAAAATPAQSTSALWTALQSSSPSSSTALTSWSGVSSSYSGAGAGAGGAKYHAGSRFYQGYTGIGRAVTQADASSANTQNDEEELKFVRRQPTATHSTSARSLTRSRLSSLAPRKEDGSAHKLGILKSVQIHVRSKHAFAAAQARAAEAEEVGVRYSSTATTTVANDASVSPPPPSSKPEATQKTKLGPIPTAASAAISRALVSGEQLDILSAVMGFRETSRPGANIEDWNLALQALISVRVPGQPLTLILDTYNDLISRGFVPNLRTYTLLISALTTRDAEVNKVSAIIHSRIKRRNLAGRHEAPSQSIDSQRMKALRSEENLASALSLFQAASVVYGPHIPFPTYVALLQSCATHGNVDAAIVVFAQLEKRTDVRPSVTVYHHLIAAYANAGDLAGVEEVFAEFVAASNEGRIDWAAEESEERLHGMLSDSARTGSARAAQLKIWNRLIQAHFQCGTPAGALSVLERMMDSTAGEVFGPTDVPPPAPSTFTAVVAGFIQSGDVNTALTWFERLLQQDNPSSHPFASSPVPPRPDQHAWRLMINALAKESAVEELNRIFAVLVETHARDGLELTPHEVVVTATANIVKYASGKKIETATLEEKVDYLIRIIWSGEVTTSEPLFLESSHSLADQIVGLCMAHNAHAKALQVLSAWSAYHLRVLEQAQEEGRDPGQHWERIQTELAELRRDFHATAAKMLAPVEKGKSKLPFTQARELTRMADELGVAYSPDVAETYLSTVYGALSSGEPVEIEPKDWDRLLVLASAPDSVSHGFTVVLLEAMSRRGVDLALIDPALSHAVGKALSENIGSVADTRALLKSLGPQFEERFGDHVLSMDGAGPRSGQPMQVDEYHSRFVDEFFPSHPSVTPLMCFDRYLVGAQANKYPTPETMGRLINGLGRAKRLDLARVVYEDSQRLLAQLADGGDAASSVGWFQVEDQMLIALAHAEDIDGAQRHRERILEHGGCPSADAYGALIQSVRDTTDDASNALKLFQEAQVRGVAPNQFLYNTIISKLAKARKVDYALELFQQMKAGNVIPTSVTYGAVIAACCRVGDAHSAEILFTEMASRHNFRPRVPPYNTMMQLYTHTKPDRKRVLHFYDLMKQAKIRPTAHTYKLLLDAYGTIEPVDLHQMEEVFKQLVADRNINVQGTHWAALINAYGCVAKDLNKALETFESVRTHPSTARSPEPLPDALVFEALINVLVTLRRTDLIPKYTQQLLQSGIHMTAYIANVLIRGHAAAGNLDEARRVFESLLDPPVGVAAPNNHAPHEASPSSAVPADAPVYREPSTWEAMIRAELGNGNRDAAIALLERLKARQYPTAVYQRIAGIMLDDSVSPWPSSPSDSA